MPGSVATVEILPVGCGGDSVGQTKIVVGED